MLLLLQKREMLKSKKRETRALSEGGEACADPPWEKRTRWAREVRRVPTLPAVQEKKHQQWGLCNLITLASSLYIFFSCTGGRVGTRLTSLAQRTRFSQGGSARASPPSLNARVSLFLLFSISLFCSRSSMYLVHYNIIFTASWYTVVVQQLAINVFSITVTQQLAIAVF